MSVSNKLTRIQPFRVMEVLAEAETLRSHGHDVISMEVGEPDFETPAPVIAAAQAALAAGHTRYTNALGIPALREAIAEFYRTDYNLTIDPHRIVVTAGGSGALMLATVLLSDPGTGWMMTDPGYPCNRNFVLAAGGEPQAIAVGPDENFQLQASRVADAWQDSTRVVLAASPANPTGTELTPQQLTDLHAVVRERGGTLVVDEIYHGLSYDSDQRFSALSLGDDVIVLNSFSKYFNMTGWRLGWLVVPEGMVSDVEKLAQNLFICPSSIAQHAALAAFTPDAREIMERNRLEMARRRDFLVPALDQAGFDIPARPTGAFYVYAGLPEGFASARSFCSDLLRQHHVAVTPGLDFGDHRSDEFVRFSYAQDINRLEEAVARIEVLSARA